MNLEGDDLRREIDDTLAELERLENEVIDLFRELLGPQAAEQVAAYKRAKVREPNLQMLDPASREAWPEPSTGRPAIQ